MSPNTHWLSSPDALQEVDALCLGTGRFLRSVLVPALVGAGMKVALIQTRGRSMMEYMRQRDQQNIASKGTYEVDTVLTDGSIGTDLVPCQAVFSLGREEDKHALVEELPRIKRVSVLGVGVTEAGLSSKDTQVMKDLYDLLQLLSLLEQERGEEKEDHKICVIDMDNVPNNGSVIESFMVQLATESEKNGGDKNMKHFLKERVVFCNTMVDRITSQRPESNGMVPRCEPTPAKALVVCDPQLALPSSLAQQPGIVVRSSLEQLQTDIALKLRIANGTHTAIAHTLALLKHLLTDTLSSSTTSSGTPADNVFMRYLDALVEGPIFGGTTNTLNNPTTMRDEATAVWSDWRQRLIHPHFGLSSFFITQNGTAKGGIRWGPTVQDLLQDPSDAGEKLQVSLALAYAVLLRWLTPAPTPLGSTTKPGVYLGWLDGADASGWPDNALEDEGAVQYADGLRYHLEQGWYEYKCPLDTVVSQLKDCTGIQNIDKKQPKACLPAIRYYLTHAQGGNLKAVADSPAFDDLVDAIAVLYARLLAGDGLETIFKELDESLYGIGFATPCRILAERERGPQSGKMHPVSVLHFQPKYLPDDSTLMRVPVDAESVESVVLSEVQSVIAIDLHTHLLPPTHGSLCLWGIDELLTYHYLVAEYFMTAPASMTPEDFYAKPKQEQADLIWQALFVDRSPLSEACRGVLTTLVRLGLAREAATRDLASIRAFYMAYREKDAAGMGEGTEAFCESVFCRAGVEYAIMTNIPFEQKEARFWRPSRIGYSNRYRSALRVDPLLAGDKASVEAAIRAAGYPPTLEGAREYLRDWCDTMNPEYVMASTPHDFVLQEEGAIGPVAAAERQQKTKKGLNAAALTAPGAFAAAAGLSLAAACDGAEDESPSVVDESSDLLSEVLMRVCEERDLPVALKIGAHRGVNPSLEAAGDGVVGFCDAGVLGRLCARFPRVRFLATFLSRNNQQEACVLATKFRNLHLYGCWWFCNQPSIIEEMTAMRLELLGTAFTAQHSDARVVDQLLYKWPHSRAVVGAVLSGEYQKCVAAGWRPTRGEIRRDVRRLFRGSYEEFMNKSLVEGT